MSMSAVCLSFKREGKKEGEKRRKIVLLRLAQLRDSFSLQKLRLKLELKLQSEAVKLA